MTSIQSLQFGQDIHLNGVEKYAESDALGELVAPAIRIWKNLSKRKVIAIAEHDEEARLIDMRRNNRHIMHYKVEVLVNDNPVRGWVMFPFVAEAVKGTYGSEDVGWR